MNTRISGSWIVYLRKKKHISQLVLASYLGISPETLRKIEGGKKVPDQKVRKKLADCFGAEQFEGCWDDC